jgi:hypothetical protein
MAGSLNQWSANTMRADVPEPPKKPETTPDVVAGLDRVARRELGLEQLLALRDVILRQGA